MGKADYNDAGSKWRKVRKQLYTLPFKAFVCNWWNGSDLYPDPLWVYSLFSGCAIIDGKPAECKIAVPLGVSCDLFDGLWYVTALSIGPLLDNYLDCAPIVEFRPQLFELKHLKSLTFFSCFVSPHEHPIIIPGTNWEKLASNLETLEFRSNLVSLEKFHQALVA
ncbi:hypothetical protein NC653_019829 [Populus alba x Populus x berolinensis]|uniref:Uncharacterized protein n=1 Tax=Populus alba x Populus x berolinensis TaxID=444605 RepID=A0AAD6MJE8_9ROSI|nr:hypothetical protein NC653_019829 [Populus alba x Populus x berolinensis]